MFSGLMSRWMMRCLCRYSSPRALWNRMHRSWCSFMPNFDDVYSSSRFSSMYSNTTLISRWFRTISLSLMMLGCSTVAAILSYRTTRSSISSVLRIYLMATISSVSRFRAL